MENNNPFEKTALLFYGILIPFFMIFKPDEDGERDYFAGLLFFIVYILNLILVLFIPNLYIYLFLNLGLTAGLSLIIGIKGALSLVIGIIIFVLFISYQARPITYEKSHSPFESPIKKYGNIIEGYQIFHHRFANYIKDLL